MSSKKDQILFRLYIVFGVFLIFSGVLLYRTIDIGVFEGEKWLEKKEDWYTKTEAIEAERGNIYASNESLLATSLQFFEVRMDFRAKGLDQTNWERGVDSLAICLSKYVNPEWSPGYYKQWLNRMRNKEEGNRYVRIARDISFEELERMKSFPIFRRGRNRGGIIINQYGKREKPFGPLAERTIGYKRDNAKDVGLESSFDQYLSGEEGQRIMVKVGQNEFVPAGDLKKIEPERGNDIVTTLDVNIQDVTHNSLLRAMVKHEAEWGTAAVMEVETGAIRAISNLKTVGRGQYAESYNYAIGNLVEPGSTIKLASYMAMVEDRLMSDHEKVDINKGYMRLCDQDLRDSEPHDKNLTSAKSVFEISSNVGVAKLVRNKYAQHPGADRFVQRLKQFRLGQKTGIEIEGEPSPYIKEAFNEDQQWSCTSLPWMSIGYEMQLTPLQILAFYNAVANNGRYMKPYLVDRVVEEGKVVQRFAPKMLDKAIASPETIERAKRMLEGVVENGTARGLKNPYFKFAGKTGTTQLGYGDKEQEITYQSSFVGYFPADDPKYACLVMVYNPNKKNGYYGAQVAGPVFRDIADRCFASQLDFGNPFEVAKAQERNIPLEHKLHRADWDFFQEQYKFAYRDGASTEWLYLKGEKDGVVGLPFHKKKERVPDVRGMALKDALHLLENAGLDVNFGGFGKVKSQSLSPGTPVKGQEIKLELG